MMCRKGIPPALRPATWLWLSGGAAKQASAPENYYRNLSSSTSELGEDVLYSVEQDVRAGFHNHKLISSFKGTEALSRILLALAQHLSKESDHGSYSYSRGLARVASLLLIVFGISREEDAFWTLAAFLQGKLFPCGTAEVHCVLCRLPRTVPCAIT